MRSQVPIKIIAQNRRARFDYEIEENIECGIALQGSEVKSIKEGRVSFGDSFAEIKGEEVWLNNLHIAEYAQASMFSHDPDRPKKLLLHRQEIKRIDRRVREKGYTLVPLSIYLKHGLVKLELGLCRGKKEFDKRADIKARDIDREIRRDFRLKDW
ncbi:MAG: SsrA-binding protein SmpB [Rectinema subterraneum]|jgi:SsrA-binding protein|uniref:SsrA-binding protein n=1 Tax=uncultured spirochete TaxID=156406 RepID=A0A3P3XF24_9SPIR|nr:SsrA-binding protein SmpB [Rectinema subterraneum]SLM09824.1 SsrA-binding protein [uncultured spirochete]HCX95523.1 SsrA-binding protein [Spirochaetaceae bacterium]